MFHRCDDVMQSSRRVKEKVVEELMNWREKDYSYLLSKQMVQYSNNHMTMKREWYEQKIEKSALNRHHVSIYEWVKMIILLVERNEREIKLGEFEWKQNLCGTKNVAFVTVLSIFLGLMLSIWILIGWVSHGGNEAWDKRKYKMIWHNGIMT